MPETDYDQSANLEDGFTDAINPGELVDERWLSLQRNAWHQSDDWFNTVFRRRLEKNLAHYKSQHAPGSKYNREEFRKRSRMFRPKTRTAIRKFVASGIRAFFSTIDVMTCEPTKPQDPESNLAATIHEEVLNWRLTNSVPWYKIVVAALTEVGINGVVFSKSYWDYEEEEQEITRTVRGPNGVKSHREFVTYVKNDRPNVRLVPLENIRISPSADWMDPIASTPYIIEERPYYISDLLHRMDTSKMIPYRRNIEPKEIRKGERLDFDSLRSAREDSYDRYAETFGSDDEEFGIVWVRECIVKQDGMDWYYETVGDNLLISDPIPLSRISKIGRGYRMGNIEIEPHTLHPAGTSDLAEAIQTEANEVVNTRLDNVKLSMTGRFIVRRGSQTDIRSLMRNIPGSVTYSQNTNDVREFRAPEVSRSSYEEQDRLNLDMDDLLGSFSQSTVQSNRALNETVGGMNMLRESANEIPEMQIRNFSETWYEPTLRDLLKLEANYESDKNVIELAGDKVGKNLNDTFRIMQRPAKVTVNVGFGNTHPLMRLEKLKMGLSTIEALVPGTLGKADAKEISNEVFGALGYKDGSRFLPMLAEEDEQDPRITQLEEQVAQLTQKIEMEQVKEQTKIQIAQLNQEGKERIEAMRQQHQMRMEQLKAMLKQTDQAIAQEQNEIRKRELWMQREALSHTIEQAEQNMEMEQMRFAKELGEPAPEGENQQLVEDLRDPSSGTPIESSGSDPIVEASDDMAGVISRGDYGNIPGAEG